MFFSSGLLWWDNNTPCTPPPPTHTHAQAQAHTQAHTHITKQQFSVGSTIQLDFRIRYYLIQLLAWNLDDMIRYKNCHWCLIYYILFYFCCFFLLYLFLAERLDLTFDWMPSSFFAQFLVSLCRSLQRVFKRIITTNPLCRGLQMFFLIPPPIFKINNIKQSSLPQPVQVLLWIFQVSCDEGSEVLVKMVFLFLHTHHSS